MNLCIEHSKTVPRGFSSPTFLLYSTFFFQLSFCNWQELQCDQSKSLFCSAKDSSSYLNSSRSVSFPPLPFLCVCRTSECLWKCLLSGKFDGLPVPLTLNCSRSPQNNHNNNGNNYNGGCVWKIFNFRSLFTNEGGLFLFFMVFRHKILYYKKFDVQDYQFLNVIYKIKYVI